MHLNVEQKLKWKQIINPLNSNCPHFYFNFKMNIFFFVNARNSSVYTYRHGRSNLFIRSLLYPHAFFVMSLFCPIVPHQVLVLLILCIWAKEYALPWGISWVGMRLFRNSSSVIFFFPKFEPTFWIPPRAPKLPETALVVGDMKPSSLFVRRKTFCI